MVKNKNLLLILYILIITLVTIGYMILNFDTSLLLIIYLEILLSIPILLILMGIRKNAFEFINVACLYMAFGFLGRYIVLKLFPEIDYSINEQNLRYGILIQLLSMLCLLVSYYLISKKYELKECKKITLTNVTYVLYFIVILSRIYLVLSNRLIVFAFEEGTQASNIGQYAFMCSAFGTTCVGFFMYCCNIYVNSKRKRIILLISICIEVIWALLSGAKTPLLELLIMWFFSKALTNNLKFNLRKISIALLSVCCVFVVNTAIRDSYSESYGRVQTNVNNQVGTIKNMDIDSTKIINGLTVLLSRNDILDSISLIGDYTPNINPYLHGEQYIYMPLIPMIPRFLWSNKPTYNDGLYNSWRYRGVPDNYYVNYAAGITGGFYWNFGFVGTLICMFIFGIILANLQNWFTKIGRFNETYFLIFSVIYLKLVTMETTFYTLYVFLFPLVIVILGIDFMLKMITRNKRIVSISIKS